MKTELFVLACGGVLALIHILAAGGAKTRQYGKEWNMGARDEQLPPPEPLVGRLMRAQANYFETFPIMAAAVLIVVTADLTSIWTAGGSILWLVARIIYLPLYAAGIPKLRSFVFLGSLCGIVILLISAIAGLI